MFERDPWSEVIGGGRGRPPRSIAILVGVLGAGVVADAVVELHPLLEGLRLSSAVWERGEVWRLVTYGLVGTGGISAWAAFELLLVYWFSMELVGWIGLSRTRVLVLGGIVVAGTAATAAQAISDALGGPGFPPAPYWMMQGQSVVLALVTAAFATHARWTRVAHTRFFWGLPIPTRWLVPLQLLFAAGGFAATRDLGGLVGIATATVWGLRMAGPRRRR